MVQLLGEEEVGIGGLNKANGGKGGFHNVRVRYLVAGATDNRLYKSNAFNRGGGQQPMMKSKQPTLAYFLILNGNGKG